MGGGPVDVGLGAMNKYQTLPASKFWEMPDRSIVINLDLIHIVRRDTDGSLHIYIPEWESAIYIKAEWGEAFLAALVARV